MENLIKKFDSVTLEFIDSLDENEEGQAFSSVVLNPIFRWAKFVLTDDKPNLNLQRIPRDEFPNLVKSGIYAPIKMANNKINIGHEDSTPIGVITHLIEDGDKILGLAALWEKEREDDIKLLKEYYQNKKPLNLSWEIYYREASKEDNIEVLHGTVLRAATLVGLPAYQGRTQISALASKNLEGKLNEEEIKALQLKATALEAENTSLNESLVAKNAEIVSLNETVSTITAEKVSLAEFKQTVEAKEAEATRLAEIKTKFGEAGIEKEETYFEENKEKLLKLDEASLEFIIQELASFKDKSSTASKKNLELPKFSTENEEDENDPRVIGRKLRESKTTGSK